jgi:hypothetical protein
MVQSVAWSVAVRTEQPEEENVVATIDSPRMSLQQVRQLVTEWFSSKRTDTVAFHESVDPVNDPYGSYVVRYEAIFEPITLDQARIELWVTAEDCVSIGFETRDRVAGRLSIKNRRSGFAAGHEPYPMTHQGLLALLEVIANGEIAIFARVVPWYGLGTTKALMLPERLHALSLKNYYPCGWLHSVKKFESTGTVRVLRYRPWNEKVPDA